jgi:hypothetical protein
MKAEFTALVQQLIAEQGRDALFNAAKCKAFLHDNQEIDINTRRLLQQVVGSGIAGGIVNTSDIASYKLMAAKKLQDDYFLAPNVAKGVVSILAQMLRGDTTPPQAAGPSAPRPRPMSSVPAPSQIVPISQEPPPIIFGASLIRIAVDKLLGRTTQLIISDISIVETGEKFEVFFDDIVDITPWEQKSSGLFTVAEYITIKVKDINKYPKFSGKAGALNKLFFDGSPIILTLSNFKTNSKELYPILVEKWKKRMTQIV